MKNVVTDLGLSGNGSTDNLAALNVAIAAWTVADGAWYWPAGTYVLSATPSVLKNSMFWFGEGRGLTAIKGTRAAPSGGAVLTIANSTSVTLKRMHITTTDDANACDQCLLTSGSTDLVCYDVKVSNGYSAGLRAASKSQLRFFGGEVTNIHQDISASGFTGDFSNSLISGTWMHDNAPGVSSNTRHFIYINGSANPSNTVIQNCVFQNWSGGECVGLKGGGLGTGDGTDAARSLSVIGCTFNQVGSSNECISAQNTIGTLISNNSVVMAGQNFINMAGINWDYLIEGNTGTGIPTHSGGNFVGVNFTLNGGGRIAGNSYAKTPGYYDEACGVIVTGSNETGTNTRLFIENNSFAGIYAGVCLTSPSTGSVRGVAIRNNSFGNQTGSVDVAAGRFIALPAGVTAGIIIDGSVRDADISGNTVYNMNYEIAFTTNVPARGSSGVSDGVAFSSVPGAHLGYFNGALPKNHPLQRVETIPL